MAPVRMKTRSEVGLKESSMLKPKLAPVVSKRKADGSPLKPATTTQIKRHLVDNAQKENMLMKTKNQLVSLAAAAAKKPLGTRNLNTHRASMIGLPKDTKKDGSLIIKKNALPNNAASKENIVRRMTLTKITETKSTSKTVSNATVKVSETKIQEVKACVVQPLGLKNVNTCLSEPIETKPKQKTDKAGLTASDGVTINTETKRVSLSQIPINISYKVKPKKPEAVPPTRTTGPVTRQSLNRKSSDNENTLYETALEDIFHDRLVLVNSLNDTSGTKKVHATITAEVVTVKEIKTSRKLPSGVEDFDLGSQDIFSVGKYAFKIFEYLKSRESHFKVANYMTKQKVISKSMRAILVDWLVDIQENFELNHETLYLAVKIIDLYLSRIIISKDQLQLLGCTAMLIACKYDERIAPSLDDFILLCDHQFSAKDVTAMECKVLKAIDYNLGCPLSYRFLRRFSRCGKFDMGLLTLARYILELSLMDFTMVLESESKLAAAALYLALRMKNESTWTPTLEYYSGYKLEDFKDIVVNLNTMLHQKPKESISTIRKKYSHEIFHRVSQIPLLDKIDFSADNSR